MTRHNKGVIPEVLEEVPSPRAPLDVESLNPEQREAVLYRGGPLLIFAGAGSGKTRVITYRIASLLEDGVWASRILAVTFTNKAAREMKDRVEALVGPRASGMWIGTFHSICGRMLRMDGSAIGIDRNFVIYDDADQTSLVREILKAKNIDDKSISPRGILNEISHAKEKLQTPERYAEGASTFFEKIASDVFKAYNDGLRRANALDFDDILFYAHRLLEQVAPVREKYQERFLHVMVDEYQDVNLAQYGIVDMIAKKHRNIVVVGDDDQCLPAGTLVATPEGERAIEEVAAGDCVVGAGGRGLATTAPVETAPRRRHAGSVVRIRTEGGRELVATFNHLMFARLEPSEGLHHVYLMYRRDKGYRIGKTRGLKVRAKGEVADKMWILKTCGSAEDAGLWEQRLAFDYGIPTTVFHIRGRRTLLDQARIDALFASIDTRERAGRLLANLGMCEEYPHHRPSAVVRGGSARRLVNLTFFGGNRSGVGRMWHEHRISLISSGETMRSRVEAIQPTRAGKGEGWRVETSRKEYDEAAAFARRLTAIEDVEVVVRARLTDGAAFGVMPARHLQPGMVVPVLENGRVVEDRVASAEVEPFDGEVYDLSVADLRSFAANGIVVHNSIYAWRGADVGLILKFTADHTDAKVVKLERNYRSTKTILAGANEVIRHNRGRASKSLWTENEEGAAIRLVQAGTETDEATLIAERIRRAVERGDRKYGEHAVLYRTNAMSRVLEEAFLNLRIPHVLIGGQRFYERREVKDLLGYMRLAYNTRDDVSFRRTVNTPARGIGPGAVEKIVARARALDLSLLDAARDQELQSSLQKKAAGSLRAYADAVTKAGELSEAGLVSPVLRLLLDESGYIEALRAERTEEALSRLENLQELLNVTAQYDATTEAPELGDFLEGVALVADVDGLNESGDAVTLMTLHAAKGLEFPVVTMAGMEEGVFPHSRSLQDDTQLEEERRLCYVGMTRAREELNLYYAQRRSVYGQPNFNRRSRFLEDLPNRLLDEVSLPVDTFENGRYGTLRGGPTSFGLSDRPAFQPSARPIEAKPKVEPGWKAPFEMGQRVRHAKFGEGTVIACVPAMSDAQVTVMFQGDASGKPKVLLQKLAKLETV